MEVKQVTPITEEDNIKMEVKNTDTVTLNIGDVVVYDTADLMGRSVKRTTTANSVLGAGIVAETILAGKTGRIIVNGGAKANVQTDGTTPIAIGNLLATSANAGKMTKGTPVIGGVVAIALEAVAISTTTSIKVIVQKA